jgi:NitT/TauT family transport system substrate-binding protein
VTTPRPRIGAASLRGLLRVAWPGVLLLAIVGCGQPVPASATPPAAASNATATTPAQATAGGAAPVKLKVGTIGLAPEAPVYLADDKGYFREEGVEIEYTNLRSSSETIPLLATGQLDFGPAGIDPSLFNAAQRETGVKMLASEAVATREGPGGAALVVAKSLVDSGEYTGVQDLKGKTIGLNSMGGVGQVITEEILAAGGLTSSDVTYAQLSFPDMATAMANNRIDAAYLTEPFVSIGVSKGISKVVMLAGDVHPGLIGLVLLGGANLKTKQDTVNRFMVAYLRGMRFYYSAYFSKPDPAGKEEVIQTIVKHTPSKDPDAVRAIAMTAVDPNGGLDKQDLQRFQDYFLKVGTQQAPVDFDQLIDTSFLETALKRLGPYQL